MSMFAFGTSLPLIALAYGSRKAIMLRRAMFAKAAKNGLPAFGGVIAVVGMSILLGADRSLEAATLRMMPEWLLCLTTHF